MSFPGEIPQFWGAENPTDFYVICKVLGVYKFKFKPSYTCKTCNNSSILLLLAACVICFIVVYKQASCIFMTFEIISDPLNWEDQSTQ